MDIVYIRNLNVETIIGIFDWERKNKQTVCINLEMASDNKKAASTENIEDALDYKAVSDRLRSFIAESEFQLIETMAEEITRIVIKEFGVSWVKLSLGKPDALPDAEVGVIIERCEQGEKGLPQSGART